MRIAYHHKRGDVMDEVDGRERVGESVPGVQRDGDGDGHLVGAGHAGGEARVHLEWRGVGEGGDHVAPRIVDAEERGGGVRGER